MLHSDLYSLEDDEEFGNIFITQEPSEDNNGDVSNGKGDADGGDGDFLGVNVMDFTSPCSSLLKNVNQYSDISDDKMLDISTNRNAKVM